MKSQQCAIQMHGGRCCGFMFWYVAYVTKILTFYFVSSWFLQLAAAWLSRWLCSHLLEISSVVWTVEEKNTKIKMPPDDISNTKQTALHNFFVCPLLRVYLILPSFVECLFMGVTSSRMAKEVLRHASGPSLNQPLQRERNSLFSVQIIKTRPQWLRCRSKRESRGDLMAMGSLSCVVVLSARCHRRYLNELWKSLSSLKIRESQDWLNLLCTRFRFIF